MKRNKASGPDEIPMEVFKEMDDDNKGQIVEILYHWYRRDP